MRFYLLIAILVFQFQVKAQGEFISYRFQVDPKQYKDFNINFTVIDRRVDTSNIGKMSQGFDFERFFVKPIPSLQEQLNSVYLKKAEGSRNFTLIINEFEILDNPTESSYIGMIRLNLDLFEKKENTYKYINSVDTIVFLKGSRLDKLLVAHSAGYMLLFINSSLKMNLNERESTTYTEMLNYDSLIIQELPLYKNENLKQGFYRTYQDLLHQTNQLEFDTLKSCRPNKKFKVIRNGKEDCYYKDSFYALVYNQQAYVNVESKWYRVNFKQKEVAFTGLMLRIDKEYRKGLEYWYLMGGVAGVMTGVVITDAINNTKSWHKIKLGKKSGKPKVIAKSERPKDDELDVDLSNFYAK